MKYVRFIWFFVFILICFSLVSHSATVTYPEGARQGGANTNRGIRNLTFSFIDTDIGNKTLSSSAIYGTVRRIVVDSNGTDTSWGLTLKDSLGISLFTKADLSSASEPYSYAIYQDDTEGNPHYGIDVCGALTLITANVGYDAEVQTLSPDAAATAGPFSLTYGGETTAGRNEVVTLSDVNDPNGGTFKLTFGGQETSAIDYDSTAAEIDTALEALSSIDVNQVVCTGGPLPGTSVVITFTEGLGNQNVGAITLTDNSLTATDTNDTASISITVTTAGLGLVYNSSIANIQTALEALSTVDANDIIVGGGPLSEDSNDTTFTFLAADGDVSMISITAAYLTGPTETPITETTKGGSDLDAIDVTIFYDENAR